MARIRTLKPEFWTDEKLAPLSPLDRLVFLGLVSLADDAGRLLDNVRVIDANLFPETSDSALEPLRRLSGIGRIRRGVTASGQRILEICNWNRHQKISHPNLKSAFPEIVEVVEDTEIPEPLRNDSGGAPEPLRHHTYDLRPVPTTNDQRPMRRKGAAPGVAGGWPAEAQAIFAEHIGLREVREFGRQLKPAVDAHGWDTVKPWWEAYCRSAPYRKRDGSIHGDRPGDKPEDAVKNPTFCSPADFVKTLTFWRQRCEPLKLA